MRTSHMPLRKARYVSYMRSGGNEAKKFEVLSENKALRMFLSFKVFRKYDYVVRSTLLLRNCQRLTQLADSIGNLKHLRLKLYGCGNCAELPTLGHLPNLKYLDIRRFRLVERIGDEFCSDISIQMFRMAHFLEYAKLEGVVICRSGEGGVFPRLQSLVLVLCPRLQCLPERDKFINGAVMVVDGGFWMSRPRPPFPKEAMRQLSRSVDQEGFM
ncbi:hypothetical protein FNV43_RR20201 [Rhamnella rubrinervis]|uniref:Uncharacterized protein n=1 Tax=Rhamnella rubrinervis TaxID=2594499 RepID=A0A8K0DZX6_9ROSA|nr:hypothetical protein FNV43_RR20201 [Rhamnella rubrinervis]